MTTTWPGNRYGGAATRLASPPLGIAGAPQPGRRAAGEARARGRRGRPDRPARPGAPARRSHAPQHLPHRREQALEGTMQCNASAWTCGGGGVRGGLERNARHIPASFMQAAVGRGQPRRGSRSTFAVAAEAPRPMRSAARQAFGAAREGMGGGGVEGGHRTASGTVQPLTCSRPQGCCTKSCRCSSASRPLAEAASPASAWATAAKRGLVAKSSGDLASSERRAFMRATDGRSSCCCCTPRLGFRVRAAAGRSCGGEGGSGGGGGVGEGGGVGAGRGRGVGAAGRTAPPLIHRCVTSRAAASAAAHLYTCWGCFVREDQSVRIVPSGYLPDRFPRTAREKICRYQGGRSASRVGGR